ncbi:MAG: hypothetical protein JNM34_08480 [Chthonomonadaceae bacterium]|nr:hypothetical protein [Chthonomonadaceae bacterium]
MSYARALSISLVIVVAVALLVRFSTVAKTSGLALPTRSDDQSVIDRAQAYLKLCGHNQDFERFTVSDPQSVEGLDPTRLLPNYSVEAYGANDNRCMYLTLKKRSLALNSLADISDGPEHSVLASEQPYVFSTEQEAKDMAIGYARKLMPERELRAETLEFWIGERNGVRARGAARFSIQRKVGDYEFIMRAATIAINTRDGSCSSVILTTQQASTAPPIVNVSEAEAFRATGSLGKAHVSKLGWWAPSGEAVARLTYYFIVGGRTHAIEDRPHHYFVDAESGRLVNDVY